MTTTPHLALPLIAAAQAQKHVTHNEALFAVDALLHCAVNDKDLAVPPASPAEGDRYIVGGAATGAWAGKTGQVAARQDGVWRFYPPQAGWIAFVVDELQLYHFNGTAWAAGVVAITNLQNLTLLGIGTAADATNPFSTKLNNVLHAGKTVAEGGTGNIQAKISKENAAKTASHLFRRTFRAGRSSGSPATTTSTSRSPRTERLGSRRWCSLPRPALRRSALPPSPPPPPQAAPGSACRMA